MSEKCRKNLSENHKGNKNPMFGKKPNDRQLEGLAIGRRAGRKHSEEAKQKISKKCLGRKVSNTSKYAEAQRKKWQDPVFKKRHSDRMKAKWENTEYRKLVLGRRTPSYYEQVVMSLIGKHGLPYKFVGNGEVWVGRANPDFINIAGAKNVIEVYGTRQKEKVRGDNNYEKDRRKYLAQYGFNVVFLNEKDLFREGWEKHCIDKIKGGEYGS